MLANQLPDGCHCSRIEIGAVPSPALLAQQVTDHPVVCADVQADLTGGIL
jgi:hypothetical protein